MSTADVVIAFDARLGNLEAASKRITASLNNVDREAKEAQRSVSGLSSSVSASFGVMGAAAAGFATGLLSVSAAVEAFKAAFKFADELADMAEQIGVSVGELQTLQLAVINAGGSAEKANKGLLKLGELIGDATRGGEEAAKVFVKLGISYQTVDGAARSTSNVLDDVRQKLEAAGTQQEKLSIAADAFGAKNAPAMVVALGGLSNGLSATAAEAVALNQALGKETTDAIGKVDDAINTLGQTIKTQLALAIASVAPQLEKFFKWIADKVNEAGSIIRQASGTEAPVEQLLRETKAMLDVKNARGQGREPTTEQLTALANVKDFGFAIGAPVDWIKLNEQLDAKLDALDKARAALAPKPEAKLAPPGSNIPPKAKSEGKTEAEKQFEKEAKDAQAFADALEKATRLPLEAFNEQLAKISLSWERTGHFDTTGGAETFLRGVLKAGEEAAQALDKAGMSTSEATNVMRERLLELTTFFEQQGIGPVDDWADRVTKSMEKVTNAADKSLAKDIKGVFTSWGRSIEKSFSGIIDGTVKTADAFDSMTKAIIDSMATLVARRFILKPLENALEPILDSLSKINFSGMFGKLFGTTASAMGNVFSGGHVLAYAQGGIISRPTLFPMARGAGLAGEAGPEGIFPLTRMASGRLGVDASGAGSDVTVNVINAAPNTTARTEEKQGMNGKEISIFIEQQVQQGIAAGRFDKSLSANFGVSRRGRY